MNTLFVGWAAVSSAPQANEDKISLVDQLYDNIVHSRKYGKMLCQFVIPGQSRDITLYSDASLTVKGWRFIADLTAEKDESLKRRIETELRALREADEFVYPYAELKKMIDDHAFDVLIFRNLGRVGRDAALSMAVTRLCHRADIITYATATPPASLSDAHGTYHRALLDAITAVGYENEISELRIKHRDGLIRRTERGLFPGQTPFGWNEIRNEKGKITGYEIDEEAATTIRIIIEKYLSSGWGINRIAEHLNELGRPTPAQVGPWQKQNVTAIINKIYRYAGYVEINKQSRRRKYVRAPGKFPSIITEDQARAVIAERESRVPSRRSVGNTYRYSRMVHCAVCGKRMRVRTRYSTYTKADGTTQRYTARQFRCNEGHGDCAESKITAYLRRLIKQIKEDGVTYQVQGRRQEAATEQRDVSDEIAAVNEQIERIKSNIARADADHYVHDKIDATRHKAIVDAANDKIEALLVRLNQLQDEQKQEEHNERQTERVQEIQDTGLAMLEEKDLSMANAWLRVHFRVHCSAGKVEWVDVL